MSAIVVIGNFDGVHRGHAAVLAEARREAEARGLDVALLTFSPHPRAVMGASAPPALTTLERKRALVARLDPRARVIVHTFDLAYAAQTPRDFATRLARELEAKVVVVGRNFRFGKDRAGDFGVLTTLGAELGFTTRSVELLGDDEGSFSSSRIRKAIANADLDLATRLLGRPHQLSGTVVHGKKLGRTIGFPTANLGGVAEMLPPFGIYAVTVDDADATRALAKGVMNVGTNPTTDADDAVKVEVMLFDFDGDLYGRHLCVQLVRFLREERRFDSLEALVDQMGKDVAAAKIAVAPLEANGARGTFG
jgi:riboflavin kinase / FMN adenylyltransferase